MRTHVDSFSGIFAAGIRGDSKSCRKASHGNSPPPHNRGAAAIGRVFTRLGAEPCEPRKLQPAQESVCFG
jgi:hypothetical protein